MAFGGFKKKEIRNLVLKSGENLKAKLQTWCVTQNDPQKTHRVTEDVTERNQSQFSW